MVLIAAEVALLVGFALFRLDGVVELFCWKLVGWVDELIWVG